ncbi:MAG: hypothetical protein KGY41_09065, partial [Desulfovermiculus sp.]|nr:hypothetical protein [Desulfovermiculus sp.]
MSEVKRQREESKNNDLTGTMELYYVSKYGLSKMKKRKKDSKSSNSGVRKQAPIATKVINSLRKESKRKVIDIQQIRDAKAEAEELEATIIKQEEMDQLDPLHAVYAYAQNKMSVFVEQLSEMPELAKLVDLYEAAEDEYVPQGPPVSPLTLSYFSCWALFDLNVGLHRESLGSIATEVCREFQADQGLIKLFEIMNTSRMGLYIHAGHLGEYVLLHEFVTGEKLKAKVISGYRGYPGEIWLVRLLPSPVHRAELDYSIVFITPYIIGQQKGRKFYSIGDEQGWHEYFDRTLDKIHAKDRVQAYEKLMKYGLDRHYWNEYIFEAYVNN